MGSGSGGGSSAPATPPPEAPPTYQMQGPSNTAAQFQSAMTNGGNNVRNQAGPQASPITPMQLGGGYQSSLPMFTSRFGKG